MTTPRLHGLMWRAGERTDGWLGCKILLGNFCLIDGSLRPGYCCSQEQLLYKSHPGRPFDHPWTVLLLVTRDRCPGKYEAWYVKSGTHGADDDDGGPASGARTDGRTSKQRNGHSLGGWPKGIPCSVGRNGNLMFIYVCNFSHKLIYLRMHKFYGKKVCYTGAKKCMNDEREFGPFCCLCK